MNKKAFSFILAFAAATSCLLPTTASAAQSAKCDTTNNFNLLQGASYQFLITASSKPNFVVGNSKVLTCVKSVKKGNHYFYTVKAIGKEKEAAGVYVNGIRQCAVTIKAPTVANGVAGTDGAANKKWIADNLGFYY